MRNPRVLKLSKADARRALIRYQFEPTDIPGVFDRLHAVQFDPLSPVGCNHDLVFQARVPGYKVGDWQQATYEDRIAYDGWDKMACLVRMDSWPVRRIYHKWHAPWLERLNEEHPGATKKVLREIMERGPLQPRELTFQKHVPEWKGDWYGPSLAKQALRALWHSGLIVTHSRKGNNHVYDLAERVIPAELFKARSILYDKALFTLLEWRHRSMGFIRPNAPFEVWGGTHVRDERRPVIQDLLRKKRLVTLDIEGQTVYAHPDFLKALEEPPLDPTVRFVAPLDQLMWDRAMVKHLFGFEYLWEVYVPEAKRRWGYYVLPVLYGDQIVARVEFSARGGILEVRQWLGEMEPPEGFVEGLRNALASLMRYSGTDEISVASHLASEAKELFTSVK